MAFEERDAAIFFGREPEIQKGLELLNRLRQFGGARMVMVLGASGSGKSSLVKAGIVPRLRRDGDRWLVVPPFRPGKEPLRELAVSLAELLKVNGGAANADSTHDLIKAAKPADAAEALNQVADEIRIAAGHREATVVLVIDQIEELLTYEAGRGAQQFLPLLHAASSAQGSPLMSIATLRSDFLGDLQLHPAARPLSFESLQLGPMPKERLVKVIEGPAEMVGLRLERGLTDAMINDTETDDALPLLAFTLRELYEKHGDDKLLQVREYRESLGGLAGSVAKAAEAVYQASPLSPEQQTNLRRALRTLVRINEEGKYVRQAVARNDLPAGIGDLLERFVQARLLVARGEGENQMLEVAHEALFRSWERLRLWLDEDREFLLWQQRLRGAAEGWERTSRDSGALLRGASLVEAERHLENHPDELRAPEREYIAQSLAQCQREQKEQEQARAERERLQKRNNQRLRVFLAIALALTAAAAWQWNSAERDRKEAVRLKNIAEKSQKEALAAKQQLVKELAIVSWKAGSYLQEAKGEVSGARKPYEQLKAIMSLGKLQSIAPYRIFSSEGPHGTDFDFESNRFGYYNADFVRWAGDNLIPAAEDVELRKLTQPVYDKYLREMARFYHLAYGDLNAEPDCVKAIEAGYQNEIKTYQARKWGGPGKGPGSYLQEAFRGYSDQIELDRTTGKRTWSSNELDWYLSNVAAGFWIRRHIDGTSGEFLKVLRKLLSTYDDGWLSSSEGVKGTGHGIGCAKR